MRVIAGTLGGRVFDSPPGRRTHPMGERVRGGLFNTLGDINGLAVLDAFAGSGALSFEAISRGAASAVAVDSDKSAAGAIAKNAGALGIAGKVKATRANISSWSDNNSDKQFDLVLADPPYDGLRPDLLQKLAMHAKPGGTIVFSLPPTTPSPLHPTTSPLPSTIYHLLTVKNYGDAQLVFYRRIS